MLDSINKKIKLAQEGIARKRKLENALMLLEREKETAVNKVFILLQCLKKEERAILKLEGFSLRKAFNTRNHQLDIELENTKTKAVLAKEKYESASEKFIKIKQQINSNKSELENLSNIQNDFEQLCNEKIDLLISNPSPTSEISIDTVSKYEELKTIENYLLKSHELARQISVMLNRLYWSFDKAINCAILQRDMYGRKMPFLRDKTVKATIFDAKSIIENIRIAAELYNTTLNRLDSFFDFGQFYFDGQNLVEFLELNHTRKTKKEGKSIILKTKTELDIVLKNSSTLQKKVAEDLKAYERIIRDNNLDFQ